MGAISKTFKSGDGVAVMLPAEWGVKPDSTLSMERDGDVLHIRAPEASAQSVASDKQRAFQEMLRRLDELGPVGEIQDREEIRIEFPDRPGLY